MARLCRAALRRRAALRPYLAISRRHAGLDALGILLAGVSRHRTHACLVLPRIAGAAKIRTSAVMAQHLFRARRGLALHRVANPYRLLRPAHVLRAPLGTFRA